MKKLAIIALTALIAAPTTGFAGMLGTGSTFAGVGDDATCFLSNLGSGNLKIDNVRLLDAAGDPASANLSSTTCGPMLAPGGTCFLSKTLDAGQTVRCQFDIKGSASKARGSMTLSGAGGTETFDAH